jgi:hypothetical protein
MTKYEVRSYPPGKINSNDGYFGVMRTFVGSNVYSRDAEKITKVNTQPPTKLYVPISYFEAHLEHFWSTFEAYLEHFWSIL